MWCSSLPYWDIIIPYRPSLLSWSSIYRWLSWQHLQDDANKATKKRTQINPGNQASLPSFVTTWAQYQRCDTHCGIKNTYKAQHAELCQEELSPWTHSTSMSINLVDHRSDPTRVWQTQSQPAGYELKQHVLLMISVYFVRIAVKYPSFPS